MIRLCAKIDFARIEITLKTVKLCPRFPIQFPPIFIYHKQTTSSGIIVMTNARNNFQMPYPKRPQTISPKKIVKKKLRQV